MTGDGNADWATDSRTIRMVRHDPARPVDSSRWPATVPAVDQVLAQEGSQVIVATHSPIVAAVPGASILELGDWGIRAAPWEELHLVGAWRRFLAEPGSYFRYLHADTTSPQQ